MHISDDLPWNNRQTEAGGLGLHVGGTMCLHIHSIYLHHGSLLHLALKNKLQGEGVGRGGESHSSCDTTTFLGGIQQTSATPNFPVKRLFWGKCRCLMHGKSS